MSSEQGATTRWVILVDGTQLASVEPGTTVEIGRKPLRPLPDDGKRRVEILDDSRSVSKRHAQLMVALDGRAFLRDLNSTNGTFVVRAGDELVRLQSGVDYPLQSDSVHVQFGDVPVDFTKFIEDDDSTKDDAPVVNLFDYAVEGSSNEPEAADMSVDDILNLRAGEPTALFNARNVANRVNLMQRSERQSFAPVRSNEPDYGDLPSVSLVQHNDVVDNAPRDLFADAAAEADAVAEQQAAEEGAKKNAAEKEKPAMLPESQSRTQVIAGNDVEHDTIPVSKLFSARPSKPIIVALPDSSDVPEQQAEKTHEQRNEIAEQSGTNPIQPEEAAQRADDERFRPHNTEQPQIVSEPTPDETSVFKPAFEPGSVFDRVAKGELAKQEQTIEVDGLTSDDAKRTDDFTVQFEMARHPELLPFLAMNPSLYDDLYAWLGALGNADIDAALSHNPGYAEYRKAVGK